MKKLKLYLFEITSKCKFKCIYGQCKLHLQNNQSIASVFSIENICFFNWEWSLHSASLSPSNPSFCPQDALLPVVKLSINMLECCIVGFYSLLSSLFSIVSFTLLSHSIMTFSKFKVLKINKIEKVALLKYISCYLNYEWHFSSIL